MDTFRTSELINIGVFVYYVVLACVRPLPRSNRIRLLALTSAAISLVLLMPPMTAVLRDWLPSLLVLLAYSGASLFFNGADSRSQAILAGLDRRICGGWTLPPSAWLEMSYMLCYAVLPAGLALLYWLGRRDYVDEFWTIVLAPTYLCYAVLPFFQTVPPRSIAEDGAWGTIRTANIWLLDRAGVGANTAPSGHAAASLGVALALISVSAPAAVLVGLVTVGIGLGAVSGGYHYKVDILAGWVLAAVGYVLVELFR